MLFQVNEKVKKMTKDREIFIQNCIQDHSELTEKEVLNEIITYFNSDKKI